MVFCCGPHARPCLSASFFVLLLLLLSLFVTIKSLADSVYCSTLYSPSIHCNYTASHDCHDCAASYSCNSCPNQHAISGPVLLLSSLSFSVSPSASDPTARTIRLSDAINKRLQLHRAELRYRLPPAPPLNLLQQQLQLLQLLASRSGCRPVSRGRQPHPAQLTWAAISARTVRPPLLTGHTVHAVGNSGPAKRSLTRAKPVDVAVSQCSWFPLHLPPS